MGRYSKMRAMSLVVALLVLTVAQASSSRESDLLDDAVLLDVGNATAAENLSIDDNGGNGKPTARCGGNGTGCATNHTGINVNRTFANISTVMKNVSQSVASMTNSSIKTNTSVKVDKNTNYTVKGFELGPNASMSKNTSLIPSKEEDSFLQIKAEYRGQAHKDSKSTAHKSKGMAASESESKGPAGDAQPASKTKEADSDKRSKSSAPAARGEHVKAAESKKSSDEPKSDSKSKGPPAEEEDSQANEQDMESQADLDDSSFELIDLEDEEFE